jgi:hypothetical protein
MTDRESKMSPCNLVKTGSMMGETNKAQILIPIKVIMIWPKDPVDTPKRAPVTRYAISTKKLAATTKKTIPIALA